MSKDRSLFNAQVLLKEQKLYIDELKNRLANKGLKYHIITYGCQMNVHDSEKLAGMLSEIGYTETSSQHDADLVLFNTCCVRENAELKVYGNVGALKAYKQANPNMIIGVCGCMMQQEEIAKFIVDRFPFVDLVFGTHNLHRFPQLILQALDSSHTIIEVLDEEGTIVEHIPTKRDKGVSAWTTIMYGCNNFCSYCIVPYVRGRERSRDPEEIVNEITKLGNQGYKEITLLGQNVNSYGKDMGGGYLFHDLLSDINKINSIERIRFMTSHPKDLSKELIRTMANSEKVCEHLHLPIQAGNNRILKAMNRKYTREEYIGLVESVREAMPDIALTTDIIVGFPGESSQEFEDTLDIIKRLKFDSAYTFIYSPRKGTPAVNIEDKISIEEKKERLAKLIEIQSKISRMKNDAYIGKVKEVLVEGRSKTNDKVLTGRTRENKIVNFLADEKVIGQLIRVKITKARSWSLEGEVL
ncbi:MAG: tRNA (N6-isopentenyl adenosine(37)-C2)-methylthiotransferase MiaB [Clostridia bacterium]|jgi:tRNA-2-methylthio-N6-dimethylallyladenosine synthase|nr:tRNA (N6-isopentenyl adenosine(37)-C2)-methylthiotransferase MiaB [Clostridia bacterium]